MESVPSAGDATNCVFVYGTLQVPAVLERVLGRIPALTRAALSGYRRGRIVGQAYPAILAAPGHCVDGAVMDVLDDSEWARLDAYEGELYTRTRVTVTLANQQLRTASCYVLGQPHASQFAPVAWSLERFVEVDLATFLGDLD